MIGACWQAVAMQETYVEEDELDDDISSAQEAQASRQALTLPAAGSPAPRRSWLWDRALASGARQAVLLPASAGDVLDAELCAGYALSHWVASTFAGRPKQAENKPESSAVAQQPSACPAPLALQWHRGSVARAA